jgi:nucleoside diphosphate kinase
MRLRGGGLDTERTYAMLKPDVVKAGKVDEMQGLIKAAGFKIIKQKKMTLTKEKV